MTEAPFHLASRMIVTHLPRRSYRQFLVTTEPAFVLCGDMAVAYFMANAPKKFLPPAQRWGRSYSLLLPLLLFFAAGPGRWAIDRIRPLDRPDQWKDGTR